MSRLTVWTGAITAAFVLGGASGCSTSAVEDAVVSDPAGLTLPLDVPPSDPAATTATKVVMSNLAAYGTGGPRGKVLFGQQEADVATTTEYGLTPLRSDIEELTGKLPAVVSYELSSIYRGATSMFDLEAFRRGAPALRDLIRAKHDRGILVSLVWHMRCPKAAASEPDRFAPADCPADYTMEELLAKKQDGVRGRHFEEWRALVGELAELLWSLKDANGQLIPVQLRPFHEMTGDWFWWGRASSATAYQQVWQELVRYLRDERGLHNVLWVFCPDKPSDRWQLDHGGDLEAFYPGDDFVDVIGFDRYDSGDGGFARGYAADLTKVGSFARAHRKIAAVTEVGRDLKLTTSSAWFTQSLLAPLKTGEGRAFAYVALWRNAPWEKYMPAPSDGEVTTDFLSMTAEVVLEGDDGDLYSKAARPSS